MPEREEFALPPDLIDFLSGHAYAGLSISTSQGTTYVLKAPEVDIEHCRVPITVGFDYEFYTYPSAPVIRTLIELHDRPDSSLRFETFINVADPGQRREFASLIYQPITPVLLYNEHLELRLTTLVWNLPQPELHTILETADLYYRLLPPETFDFDLAKALLMQEHPLIDYGTR